MPKYPTREPVNISGEFSHLIGESRTESAEIGRKNKGPSNIQPFTGVFKTHRSAPAKSFLKSLPLPASLTFSL
jgi:hypothetical protein